MRQQLRVKRMRLDHGKHADGAIEMTCLVASEIDAPAGVKPVCWRLLTNREVTTSAQIIELIAGAGLNVSSFRRSERAFSS